MGWFNIIKYDITTYIRGLIIKREIQRCDKEIEDLKKAYRKTWIPFYVTSGWCSTNKKIASVHAMPEDKIEEYNAGFLQAEKTCEKHRERMKEHPEEYPSSISSMSRMAFAPTLSDKPPEVYEHKEYVLYYEVIRLSYYGQFRYFYDGKTCDDFSPGDYAIRPLGLDLQSAVRCVEVRHESMKKQFLDNEGYELIKKDEFDLRYQYIANSASELLTPIDPKIWKKRRSEL